MNSCNWNIKSGNKGGKNSFLLCLSVLSRRFGTGAIIPAWQSFLVILLFMCKINSCQIVCNCNCIETPFDLIWEQQTALRNVLSLYLVMSLIFIAQSFTVLKIPLKKTPWHHQAKTLHASSPLLSRLGLISYAKREGYSKMARENCFVFWNT